MRGGVFYAHKNVMGDSPQAAGEAILEELHRQRNQIESSQRHLVDTNASIEKSERVLDRMSSWWRRMF